ncbi:MAG: hypothetical protein WAU88_14320 [Candidatus Zixiibacteriota bacterium]
MARQRILIISYSYAPQPTPRALRWSSLANYWVERGMDVDIITGWQNGLPEIEYTSGTTVYRVGRNLLTRLQSRLNSSPAAPTAPTTSQSRKSVPFKPVLKWLYDRTWKKLYWPDYACLWIKPAVRAARQLLKAHSYAAIVSVSDPFSGHVVAYRTRPLHNSAKWLVDIGDPFSFREAARPNNFDLYQNRNITLESDVFGECDAISVTTEGTAREYVSRFPNAKAKLTVIGPLMPAITNPVTLGAPAENRSVRKLVFVGTLYQGLRSPEYLLKLFVGLKRLPQHRDVELHIYGGVVGTSNLFDGVGDPSANAIYVHGQVSRERALEAMSDADLLVNIGNTSAIQLPSKVVEYVWLGRPILNIASHDNDSSYEYLKGHPAMLNLVARTSHVDPHHVAQLDSFMRVCPVVLPTSSLDSLRSRSRIDRIASQYAHALNLPIAVPEQVVNRIGTHYRRDSEISIRTPQV